MKTEKETTLATTTPFTPRVWEWRPFEWMKGLTRPMGWFYQPLMPFSGTREFREFEFAPFPVEVRETDEGFVVYATLPGFTKKEIEVRAEPWGVYITAKHEEVKEEKKGKPVYSEQTYKQVARWVEMPAEIDPNKVTAVLHKGMLEVALQKAQATKKIPVEVKAA